MKPVNLNPKHPSLTKKTLLNGLALTACLFALPVSTAYAGFEWTPPPKVQKPLMPLVKAAPSPDVTPMPLPLGMMADKTSTGMMPDSVIEREILTGLPPSPINYEIREGFGRDIALALAMRQIVPEGYAYSFDPGIDPGMLVSWEGGKPWNQILEESLSPYGLTLLVVQKTVWILPVEKIKAYEEKHGLTPSRKTAMATGYDNMAPRSPIKEPVFPYYGADGPISLTPSPMDAAPYSGSAPLSGMKTISASHDQQPTSPDFEAIGLNESDSEFSYTRRQKPSEASAESTGFISTLKGYTKKIKNTLSGKEETSGTVDVAAEQGDMMPPPSYQHQEEPLPVPLYTADNVPSITDIEISPMAPPADTSYMTPDFPPPITQDFYAGPKWQASAGDPLHAVLAGWAQAAGVTLIWDTSADFDLPHDVRVDGSFPEAVTNVLTMYDDMDPQPRGRLHTNPSTGQPALVISTNS